MEEEREKAREKGKEKRKKVKKEWRRRTREKAVRCEVDEKVMISGVSQPTLALGRQTSDRHAGQD
jgi:hypothetical protein